MSAIVPTSVMRAMMGKMIEQTLARRDGRGPQVRGA